MEKVRAFALVVIDDFERELDRFTLDYVEAPKNLGFEMEFTTIESRLTTYFTSAREKKIATTLTLNFLPPRAYEKVNAFRFFVQKHMNDRVVLEYNDTTSQIKNWEGKVQKLNVTEKEDWGGMTCEMQFLPGTPKYQKIDNTIYIKFSTIGKSYPFKYPYAYGKTLVENNSINNDYFDEIPLRVFLYGSCASVYLALSADGKVYSKFRMNDFTLAEGEHLVIDAISSKVQVYRNGAYQNAYDYVDKSSEYDSFLFAKEAATSQLISGLTAQDSGEVRANYRQYLL